MKPFVFVLVLLAGLALAQAAPRATTTVANLRAKPTANAQVVLTGQVAGRSSANTYQFSDATGEIDLGGATSAAFELPLGARVTVEGRVRVDPLGNVRVELSRVWLPNGRVLNLPPG